MQSTANSNRKRHGISISLHTHEVAITMETDWRTWRPKPPPPRRVHKTFALLRLRLTNDDFCDVARAELKNKPNNGEKRSSTSLILFSYDVNNEVTKQPRYSILPKSPTHKQWQEKHPHLTFPCPVEGMYLSGDA